MHYVWVCIKQLTITEVKPPNNQAVKPEVTSGQLVDSTEVKNWHLDAPQKNSIVLQDPATASMEAIHILNDHILFIMIQIVFFVFWLVAVVLTHYHQWVLSDTTHFYDDSLLEASWTTIPGIILYTILSPSLDVLYFFEDPYVPEITVKAVGHQWYWHYELSDIKTC